MNEDFTKTTSWLSRNHMKHFDVEVKHRYDYPTFYNGPNQWFIYANIYENHPLFKDVIDVDYDSKIFDQFQLNQGCTFHNLNYNQNGIYYVKFGCDYLHYNDEFYSHLEPSEDNLVFDHAKLLYKQLLYYQNLIEFDHLKNGF